MNKNKKIILIIIVILVIVSLVFIFSSPRPVILNEEIKEPIMEEPIIDLIGDGDEIKDIESELGLIDQSIEDTEVMIKELEADIGNL